MKPTEHQETHTTMEETPSNNKEQTTEDKKVYEPKASIQGLFRVEASKRGLPRVEVDW